MKNKFTKDINLRYNKIKQKTSIISNRFVARKNINLGMKLFFINIIFLILILLILYF
jgi:hypothetical protein